jgi:2-dehydro-3-deoxygluconokinase
MTEPLIVGVGEALVRFTALHQTPLATAQDYRANVAGSELNVLIAAKALGVASRFVTRLPTNDLAQLVRRHAAAHGVDLLAIDEVGGRVGTFFLEVGATPRPSSILYDRADSAASHLGPADFDWETLLGGATVAHSTGITCALGTAHEAVEAFFRAARRATVTTSFDVNYRSQLWTTQAAAPVLRSMLDHVDILFASEGDLQMLLGATTGFLDAAHAVRERYGVTTVIVRERTELSSGELSVRVHVINDTHTTAEASGRVVDELGAGDAAAGAFLAATVRGEPATVVAEQTAKAYARMLTIPGDAWVGSLNDLTTTYVSSRTLVR